MYFLYDHEQYFYNKRSAVAEMGDRGHNRHGPKREGTPVPLSRGAGSLSNTMWLEPRSTSVRSGVFIHSAVWLQWAENWGLCPFWESWVPV